MDLFGEVEEVQRKPSKPVKPWSDEVRLKGEKDTLGVYLTGHPIDVYRPELKAFISQRINELTPTRTWCNHCLCRSCGRYGQLPNRMMVTLDDGTASYMKFQPTMNALTALKTCLQNEKVRGQLKVKFHEREGFDRPMGR